MIPLLSLLLATYVLVTAVCQVFNFKGILWSDDIQMFALSSSQWVHMSSTEALSFFTFSEICNLLVAPSEQDFCSSYPGQLGDCSINSIGIGHNTGGCINPPGHFLIHASTKPWPDGKNLIDIAMTIGKIGSNSILIIGDSMSRQFFSDSYCSLKRFGVPALLINGNGSEVVESRVLVPGRDQQIPKFQILYVNLGHDYLDKDIVSVVDMLASGNDVRGKMVVVANIGLHFNYANVLHPVMDKFIAQLVSVAEKGHLTFFRETSAQHFNTESGIATPNVINRIHRQKPPIPPIVSPVSLLAQRSGFSDVTDAAEHGVIRLDVKNVSTSTSWILEDFRCHPIKSDELAEKQNFRNKIALEYLTKHDKERRIRVIPFFNLTVPRHDHHMMSGSHVAVDCTHFCNGPMIWLPVWDFLAQEIEKRLI